MQVPIAYFWQEFSHRCKMAFVLIWLVFVFLFHLSAAQDGWFYMVFCPCLPIYTDVLPCFLHFHNKVRLPRSPSVGWGHPDGSSLLWALQAHFYIILPSFPPSDATSRAPAFTFGCRQTQTQRGPSPSRLEPGRGVAVLACFLPCIYFGRQQLAASGKQVQGSLSLFL